MIELVEIRPLRWLRCELASLETWSGSRSRCGWFRGPRPGGSGTSTNRMAHHRLVEVRACEPRNLPAPGSRGFEALALGGSGTSTNRDRPTTRLVEVRACEPRNLPASGQRFRGPRPGGSGTSTNRFGPPHLAASRASSRATSTNARPSARLFEVSTAPHLGTGRRAPRTNVPRRPPGWLRCELASLETSQRRATEVSRPSPWGARAPQPTDRREVLAQGLGHLNQPFGWSAPHAQFSGSYGGRRPTRTGCTEPPTSTV